jgi:uncharacterized membrane protein
MTEGQRKEYDYKFRKKPFVMGINGMLSLIVVFILVCSMFIVLSTTATQMEELNEIKDDVFDVVRSLSLVMSSVGAIIIIYLAGYLVELIARYFNEYWWRKKNHIKSYYKPFWRRR